MLRFSVVLPTTETSIPFCSSFVIVDAPESPDCELS
jgi:hypothetical protein